MSELDKRTRELMDIEAPIEAHSRYAERGTRNECDTPSDKIYKRDRQCATGQEVRQR